MTIRYAIVAFPIFNAPDRVEGVRRRFDPLAGTLSAHVTLVFPFEGGPNRASIAQHVAVRIKGVEPFAVTFTDPSVEDGGYIFLNVVEGRQQIVDLHDRLYSGPLAQYLSADHAYRPHVTLGHMPSSTPSESMGLVAADACAALTLPVVGRINSLSLFRLENDAQGSIEFAIDLGGAPAAV
jgi:2'-5' RNA ligase